MLSTVWRQLAQHYSLDCANMSDAASTEYTGAAEIMAAKIQLEMKGPLNLELVHSIPSLVPCCVCPPMSMIPERMMWDGTRRRQWQLSIESIHPLQQDSRIIFRNFLWMGSEFFSWQKNLIAQRRHTPVERRLLKEFCKVNTKSALYRHTAGVQHPCGGVGSLLDFTYARYCLHPGAWK